MFPSRPQHITRTYQNNTVWWELSEVSGQRYMLRILPPLGKPTVSLGKSWVGDKVHNERYGMVSHKS